MVKRSVAAFLSCVVALGPITPSQLWAAAGQQQGQSSSEQRDGAQTGIDKRPPSSDIISENVARVARTVDQIFAVLTKDSGLMVEFQLLYAQQAGLHGQLLEEAGLMDIAINEKLRQDLRLRMLATKLLQRYGYLLPRINSDSEMAEERLLFLRQKAAELQRTAARQDFTSPLSGGTTCDTKADLTCLAMQAAAGAIPQSGAPSSPQPEPQQPTIPDFSNGPQEVRAANAQPNNAETLLASMRSGDGAAGGLNGLNGPNIPSRGFVSQITESPIPPQASHSAALTALAMVSCGEAPGKTAAANSNGAARTIGGVDIDQLISVFRGGQPGAAELEPVRMVHKANPCASAPALYDLYVQAAAKNNSGWWAGDPMKTALKPGDTIVVPEKPLSGVGRNWTGIMQMAQIAGTAAFTAAYVVK